MIFQVFSDSQHPLDAHFDVNGRTLTFHSRGGTKGQGARNTDYAQALRHVLERLHASRLNIEGIWVDSSKVQGLPLADRALLTPEDRNLSPAEVLSLISRRMRFVGQSPEANEGGNSTKRLRIDLITGLSELDIAALIGGRPTNRDLYDKDHLPAHLFEKVTAEYVWLAIQKLSDGYSEHSFGASTDYDLLVEEGASLPPKAVFGIAASMALGFEVQPGQFSAGLGTPCFRILERSGFAVVPKSDPAIQPALPSSPEDQEWTECQPRLIKHLVKERAKGLSQAKKAAFKREHGSLFCERCKMDPIQQYGQDAGEACVEVHHREVQVKDMMEGHRTQLEDLECLCANCHRVTHRLLKQAIERGVGIPLIGEQS